MHRFLLFMLTMMVVGGSLLAAPAAAQTGERCFAETGFCISGPIRAYWERNGGLPVFGFPVTAQRVETVEGRTLQVQWFERDRLEIQADGLVTAGRLGARFLELTGRPWQQFPAEQPVSSLECQFFPQTRFNVCGWFLGHWQRNGGLERFGYPISPVFEEQIEGRSYSVQYFERRRMEYHPENRFPYDVLLGLLGREVLRLDQDPLAGVPACAAQISPALKAVYTRVQLGRPLGCPTLLPGNDLPASTIAMERGHMLWIDRQKGPLMLVQPARIFAIIAPGNSLSFRVYSDTWVAGQDPDRPAGTPPQPDLFAPWRGFGKVWSQDAELRRQIGWAREAQARPDRVDFQAFDSGILLVHLREAGYTYAFGNSANPGEVQVIR
jgi:hypothetical protein